MYWIAVLNMWIGMYIVFIVGPKNFQDNFKFQKHNVTL